jgi:hypothetical protein
LDDVKRSNSRAQTHAEVGFAFRLMDARRRFLQADREVKEAREAMIEQAVDQLARRRWLEALGRREIAAEETERLETVMGLSDELGGEILKS